MKKFVLSVIMIATAITPIHAQVNFSAKGIAPQNTKYVLVKNLLDFSLIDSIPVKHGKFKIEKVLPEEMFLEITSEGKNPRTTVIVDATPITVDLSTLDVKGSPLNMKFNDYNKKMSLIMNHFERDYEAYRNSKGEAAKAIRNKLESYDEQLNELSKKALLENPDNIIPAAFLSMLAPSLTYEELKAALNETHPYSHHPMCKRAWKELEMKDLALCEDTLKQIIKIANEIPARVESLTELNDKWDKIEKGVTSIRGGAEYRDSYDGTNDRASNAPNETETLS